MNSSGIFIYDSFMIGQEFEQSHDISVNGLTDRGVDTPTRKLNRCISVNLGIVAGSVSAIAGGDIIRRYILPTDINQAYYLYLTSLALIAGISFIRSFWSSS